MTMKKAVFALTFAIAALAATTITAQQNRNCADRQTVLARLATGFGESRQSIGLAPNNSVVEVFASEETGTWTITVTLPNGMTCLVASGNSFETLAEALPTQDSDA
jgi:hypothetical protein